MLGAGFLAWVRVSWHLLCLSGITQTSARRSGAATWAATEKFGISVARLQRDWINRAKSAPTQSLSKIAQSGVELNFET